MGEQISFRFNHIFIQKIFNMTILVDILRGNSQNNRYTLYIQRIFFFNSLKKCLQIVIIKSTKLKI